MDAHKNFARSAVVTAPSPPLSGVSLVVAAGEGALFPAPPFNVTVWPAGQQPLAATAEIVRVTAIVGDTLTLIRAQEGSSARAIGVGDQVAATITAKTLTDIETRQIANADVAALAAIAYSKLNLTGAIVNADIVSLSGSKITGSVASAVLAGASTVLATPRTINGVNFDGSTNITIGVAAADISGTLGVGHGGTGTSTAFTAGSVVFAGASGVYSQDNANFFWDATNKRLSIGTSTSSEMLYIFGSASTFIRVRSSSNTAVTGIYLSNNLVSSGDTYFTSVKTANDIVTGSVTGDTCFRNNANMLFSVDAGTTAHLYLKNGGAFGIGTTNPTATLHLKAGTATASTAPLKFTSGTLLTTPEAGAVEFLTDTFYGTITTGAARKQFLLNDGTAFTAGSIPFATTNGRLTEDNANFFWDATNKILGVGTNAPAAGLHLKGPSGTGASLELERTGNRAWLWQVGGSGSLTLNDLTGGNEVLRYNSSGLTGFGVTSPTAIVHVRAGTATASTAPLKFTSGTLLTTAEAGALEFLTDAFYGTITTGAARKTFAFLESPIFTGTVTGPTFLASGSAPAFKVLDTTGTVSAYINNNGNFANFVINRNPFTGGFTDAAKAACSVVLTCDAGDSYIRFQTTPTNNSAPIERVRVDKNGNVGFDGNTSIGSRLQLPAGTASANTAPLQFTSGTLETTPRAGVLEFLTDDYFATITTGAARKAFILDDGSRLTSGKIPVASTNGRLVDGQTPLGGVKVYYVSDTNGGAVTRKLTFTGGILTTET